VSGRLKTGVKNLPFVNGKRITKTVKRHVAYVLQDDIMFQNLTVGQTLLYTARLRMPSSVSYKGKKKRVIGGVVMFLFFLFLSFFFQGWRSFGYFQSVWCKKYDNWRTFTTRC